MAFLYRIARNLQIDQWRQNQHARAWDPTASKGCEYTEDQLEKQRYVTELMNILPKDEQNLLLMRYWLGMAHKEIAQTRGIAQGTIRRQVATALKKLQQHWKNER